MPWKTPAQWGKATWITLLAVLALSFLFEIGYRRRTGRSLKLEGARV